MVKILLCEEVLIELYADLVQALCSRTNINPYRLLESQPRSTLSESGKKHGEAGASACVISYGDHVGVRGTKDKLTDDDQIRTRFD